MISVNFHFITEERVLSLDVDILEGFHPSIVTYSRKDESNLKNRHVSLRHGCILYIFLLPIRFFLHP